MRCLCGCRRWALSRYLRRPLRRSLRCPCGDHAPPRALPRRADPILRHPLAHAARRFSVYSWALLKGKGTRDPATGTWLPTTENQRWTWWLSLGLIFYNDPVRGCAWVIRS